jgi:hypothetical protein
MSLTDGPAEGKADEEEDDEKEEEDEEELVLPLMR